MMACAAKGFVGCPAPVSAGLDPRPLTKSADGDPQCLEAAQHIVQYRLLLQDREAPNSWSERGEQSDHLHSGEIHADTRMGSCAKPELIPGSSKHIESIRVGILTLVAVGGAVKH